MMCAVEILRPKHFEEAIEALRTPLSVDRSDSRAFGRTSATVGGPFYRGLVKRVLDVVLVLLSLPVVIPVCLVLAGMVCRDGHNPFFGHQRIGRGGKVFKCWKIRTMVPDAATRLREHLASNAAARAEWEENFKLEDDPRITQLGRFLRRSSLDELPQLWNILKGEMSIVGPRPVTEDELERYGHYSKHYRSVRPGLTGLWQISGRNDVSYDERVRLDAHYVRSFGFALDTVIILRTAGAVLGQTGR